MLYIEAGQLLDFLRRRASLTGIQRLTLVCAKYLPALLGPENVRFLAFDHRSNTFRAAHASDFLEQQILGRDHVDLKSRLWYEPDISAHDIMLFTESWWWPASVDEAVVRLKTQSGARLFRFIHDVIPIVGPQYVAENFPRKFLSGLEHAVKSADIILTNSNASKKDIESALANARIPARPVKVIPLAHELETQQHFTRPPSPWHPLNWRNSLNKRRAAALVSQMKKRPHVLCVGTLEQRKNILRLLQIWQHLAETHGDALPQLVLAGRWGWDGDVIRKFLKKTHYLNGEVKVLVGADDDVLKQLYEQCLFSIYLSHYEGWGLPVGESMGLAKPVIASNTSSIPEVGGQLVDYVDPADDASIAAAIEKMTFNHAHRQQRIKALKAAKLRSWHEFAVDLVNAMEM